MAIVNKELQLCLKEETDHKTETTRWIMDPYVYYHIEHLKKLAQP